MPEEEYNQIVKEFLDISARTTLIAREVRGGYGCFPRSVSINDMKEKKEIKNRLFKVLPEMDSKQLIKLLGQTKDFEVSGEIEKELVKR